ncbi:MAG TPA: hypothetical protein VGG99_15795 [Acetobacteraceae bacterium]|jgi:hypothetical protein
MAVSELDKLIVEHLADIDAAVKRLEALQAEVFGALDSAATDWARKNGWAGKFDYLESGLWFAPPEWRVSGTEEDEMKFQARFEMEVGAGDSQSYKPEEDYFYLTRLCRAGSGQIGFRFKQELITKGQWKRRFKELTYLAEKTAFVADSVPSFFLPFQVEGAKLAESIQEEAVEMALTHFENTLTQIIEARSEFDAVVAAIKP